MSTHCSPCDRTFVNGEALAQHVRDSPRHQNPRPAPVAVAEVAASAAAAAAEDPPKPRDPVAQFFAQYPTFRHDPDSSCWAEFLRLSGSFGWESGHAKSAYAQFSRAVVLRFGSSFDGVRQAPADFPSTILAAKAAGSPSRQRTDGGERPASVASIASSAASTVSGGVSLELQRCQPCNRDFVDLAALQQHLSSSRHHSSIPKPANDEGGKPADVPSIESAIEAPEVSGGVPPHLCVPCNRQYLCSEDLQQHQKSSKHDPTIPTTSGAGSSPATSGPASPPSDVPGNSSIHSSVPCDRTFASNQALQQHLNFPQHSPKATATSTAENSSIPCAPSAPPDLYNIPESSKHNPTVPATNGGGTASDPFTPNQASKVPDKNSPPLHRCTPCNRSFIDQAALQQHLSSSVHAARRSQRKKRTPIPPLHRCIPCNRGFIHQGALLQHLSSSVHAARPFTPIPSHRQYDAIDAFFSSYRDFDYDPTGAFWGEFERLCRFFSWEREDPTAAIAWNGFQVAVVTAFGVSFGTDQSDLEAWGRLCETAGFDPIPDTLEARHDAIIGTHINLVDMHECRRMGCLAEFFDSRAELRAYTICTGKYYPQVNAYAGNLLQYLLRGVPWQYGWEADTGMKIGRSR